MGRIATSAPTAREQAALVPVSNTRRVWCAWAHGLGGPGLPVAVAALPCTVST